MYCSTNYVPLSTIICQKQIHRTHPENMGTKGSYYQNALRDTPDGRKKAREQYRKHYERNTLKYIVKGGERRATRVKATPAWYKRGDAAPFYALARELTEKTGIQHVVDHIIPLRGKNVCGLHVKENLQVIPAKENLRKHNHYAG